MPQSERHSLPLLGTSTAREKKDAVVTAKRNKAIYLATVFRRRKNLPIRTPTHPTPKLVWIPEISEGMNAVFGASSKERSIPPALHRVHGGMKQQGVAAVGNVRKFLGGQAAQFTLAFVTVFCKGGLAY